MRVRVLGSAAGGGFPQWNCACPVCRLAWDGSDRVRARTQTSLALTANDVDWLILDASPDLRQQILQTSALRPQHPGRHSPIQGVVLTSGDVDHLAGLLCLREGHAFTLYGTETTLAQVSTATLFGVLNPAIVTRQPLRLDVPIETGFGLTVRPFAVPGKVPLYLETEHVALGEETETVIGLEIGDGAKRVFYVPGCADVSDGLAQRLDGADLLLFDGTTFTNDEMPTLGLSKKTAARMGHLAMSGEAGSLHALDRVKLGRKVYIHINNTNPVLIEDSPERAVVTAAGWDVAHDGMEIML
ncbi:pyrroloquinoline quinone biosynthesis protein PqqB [Lichenihabitans sp. PAMC28606]|uniref:pyrroloquinoline quinone biosynthesis protein PqqB n=1 Tax=Lichenihabitans sp. PAMC28606 TaxID=2880932 RepID=UPI001D09D842|nr:pyrroloquinoline quinone biosynthesis protein PqqB [Lichenihabitans sp. PAMC28606]UDL93286.1 pyrroloquinoline quinone biosynthesis protein PqqB [Lichenihabitans sp. PAMC28606]